MAELLTEDERKFVRDLGDLWGDLCNIVGNDMTRRGDLDEAIMHVHALQHLVLSQAAGRAYPEEFRLLGETLR